VFSQYVGVWLQECAGFVYAKFARDARFAHIEQAGSMFYYSLHGETATEATVPMIMRESSILSKAGVDNVRFSFLRS
jgi:hypothetical protein